jgi:hypothetical protein
VIRKVLLRQVTDDLPTDLPTDNCKIDADLGEVMDAWTKVPKVVRDDIVAMVRSSRKSGKSTERSQALSVRLIARHNEVAQQPCALQMSGDFGVWMF